MIVDHLDTSILRLVTGHEVNQPERDCLLVLVSSVLELWRDLRCQRSCYELDNIATPRARFFPETMEDFKMFRETLSIEDDACLYVAAVVVPGLVKKPFAGSGDVTTVITKALVCLTEHL